jgi:hypothetical protein
LIRTAAEKMKIMAGGYEDEDEEFVQPPLSSSTSLPLSSSWQPPQQLSRRSANNISGEAVGINLKKAPHVIKDSTPLLSVHVILHRYYLSAGGRD